MEEKTIQTKNPSLFGMIFNPREQFDRIREKPVIWLPLILLSLLAMIVAIFVTINVDFATMPGMEMSAEEEEMARIFGIAFGALGGLFGTPISYLIFGAILFGIAKIAKSRVTFKQMFSLMIFISFISMIGQILNQIIIVAIDGDPYIMLTSLNSFIGADGALGGILGVIEVFSIWYYILLTIGLVKVAKLPKPTAYIITIVFFSFSLIIAAISGALEGLAQF